MNLVIVGDRVGCILGGRQAGRLLYKTFLRTTRWSALQSVAIRVISVILAAASPSDWRTQSNLLRIGEKALPWEREQLIRAETAKCASTL